MKNKLSHSPSWDTSSLGHPAEVTAVERAALSEHLSLCAAMRGPLHLFQSGAATVQSVLAGRVITSVLIVLVLAGVVWLLA